MIKSRRIRWAGPVARSAKFLLKNLKGRNRNRSQDNIKINLEETWCREH
jgi:hypothetical protein